MAGVATSRILQAVEGHPNVGRATFDAVYHIQTAFKLLWASLWAFVWAYHASAHLMVGSSADDQTSH